MTVLKWAFRHGTLDCEPFETLADAVRAAGHASDCGEESLDCIEIVGGRIVSSEEIWRLRDAQEEEEHKDAPPRKQPQYAIKVRGSGDGKWAWWSTHVDEGEFVTSLDKAVALVGEARVAVFGWEDREGFNGRWVEVA